MSVYLVRHAKAGDRDSWHDVDEYRPLSGRGHVQSLLLVDVLADATFDHILSSPYVRCMESMIPLAVARGIALEPSDALAEGADLGDASALVRKHAAHGAVLCTHGDILPMLLNHYAAKGVDLGPDPQCPKGCTWVLDTDESGEVRSVQYLPPPS